MPCSSKRWRLCLLVGMLISLLIFSLIILSSARGPNQAKFAKIQMGISEKEVQVILGGPPGDYTGKNRGYRPGRKTARRRSRPDRKWSNS